MIEEIDKIFMDYLQVEIERMQKTAKVLEKMIDDKYPEKDDDLIETLRNIRSTTLKNIDDKKRELKCLYNKKSETDNS